MTTRPGKSQCVEGACISGPDRNRHLPEGVQVARGQVSLCLWLSLSLLPPVPWGASSGTAKNHGLASGFLVHPRILLLMVWVEEQSLVSLGTGDGQGGRSVPLLEPAYGLKASLENCNLSLTGNI